LGRDRAVSRIGLVSVALGVLLGLSGVAGGQATASPEVERQARRIFTVVMSPYCPGLLLADCTSSAAAALRDSIKAELGRGRSAEEILEELAATFGDEILALPPNRGVARLAWLAPVLALVASLGILVWRLRRRREATPVLPPSVPAVAGEEALRQRLEAELRREV
jgi:cytochrome c-type biogenesis protein CcmH